MPTILLPICGLKFVISTLKNFLFYVQIPQGCVLKPACLVVDAVIGAVGS